MRLLTELSGKREVTERTLHNEMFMKLTESFANTDYSISQKLLELELFAASLSDYADISPFFEQLIRQIDTLDLSYSEKQGYMYRLHRIAREVTSKQTLILEAAGDWCVQEILFDELNREYQCILVSNDLNTDFRVSVLEKDKENKQLQILLEVREIFSELEDMGVEIEDKDPRILDAQFWVGYFDFPIANWSRLPNSMACSVVLNNFEDSIAYITILYYPIRLTTWDPYNLFQVKDTRRD